MTIHSHLLLMALFSLLLAVVSATLLKDTVREQLWTGGKIFGGLVAGAVALGWLLYFLPF